MFGYLVRYGMDHLDSIATLHYLLWKYIHRYQGLMIKSCYNDTKNWVILIGFAPSAPDYNSTIIETIFKTQNYSYSPYSKQVPIEILKWWDWYSR